MTVKELIAELQNVDQEKIVILSKDSEGNSYSPLGCMDDNSTYLANTEWSGEVGLAKLTPELEERGFSEEDVLQGEPALVLWPRN